MSYPFLKSKNKEAQNKLYYGDNIEVLRKYIRDESIDLCYIDPPFNSKRTYNQIYKNIGKEDKAQSQAFIDTWTWDWKADVGFTEIIENYNGVFTLQSIELIIGLSKVLKKGSLLAYLVSMTLRIAEIYRVLKPTGSFYLHCDPTASHYLKLIIDAIFCAKDGEFQNEIIWCYTSGGKSNNRYAKKHDVIFFYTKSGEYIFNDKEIRVPYSEKTLANYKPGLKGSTYTADVTLNKDGKIPEDYWNIAIASKSTKEYLGYPTQKPLALLERIIKASTNEGDLVLDAYCGCGTTVAVAEQLKRKWIGIDITYASISLILKRIEEHFGGSAIKNINLNGVPKDFESAVALANKQDDRTRKEFEKWAVLTYSNNKAAINDKKGGDGGIDGTAYMVDFDDKNKQIQKQILFSVKSNKTIPPSVIRDLNGTMEREDAAMGILITLYPMPNLVKESKKYGVYINKAFGQTYPKIEVISIAEMLAGNLMKMPTSVIDVLKKAGRKAKGDEQGKMDLE